MSETLQYRYVPINYHMCDEARDTSPEGLAFLYTLRDLEIFHVTNGLIYMKTCMLKYFEDKAFIDRRAIEICAEIAKLRDRPVKDVCDGIKSAMYRVWQGYNFYKLREKFGFDSSLKFKEMPKTVELMRVFCEIAWKYYEPFLQAEN